MATIIFSTACCTAAISHEGAGIRRSSTASSVATSLVSRFHGLHLSAEVKAVRSRKLKITVGKTSAAAVVNSGVKQYSLPSWADFEMGRYTVYWDTATGRPPTSGQLLTIYFNSSASELTPNSEYGIGFNGGFNQPIMCGGEPRVMTKKERGSTCEPMYSIKINVPLHGKLWEVPFMASSTTSIIVGFTAL